MYYMFSRTFMVCIITLLCVGPLFAANATSDALAKDKITGLTADQAVKLGSEKFIELYLKKTNNESTAGNYDASITYARLRSYVNDRAAAKRTKQQQEIINKAEELCGEIAEAYIDIDEAQCGGGSIHQYDRAGGAIQVENYTGKLILSMERSTANPHARAEAEKIIKALIGNIGNLPKAETDRPDESQEWKKQHDEAIAQLKSALPQLLQLIKSVPDNGAFYLARFAHESSKYVEVE